MKARLVIHDKVRDIDGNITEVKLWEVKATPDKPHGYKYSLVYVVKGNRVIGYDNAEMKGDHRHYGNRVEPYRFENVRKLLDDFYKEIHRFKEGIL
ncbi:MAG TPA: toxin-antitoxin system TumE family protein [Candidatus Brocadiia bacterium]|nr:hypothetical protein [Planctomycetota bacterium]MDO8093071.1 DUF6516 family protein [Candidatus Brocadiales bacterium]